MAHYAGVVVYKYVNGALYMLIQGERPLNAPHEILYKFPGGSNSDHLEEHAPIETAFRELEEETHLSAKKGYVPQCIYGPADERNRSFPRYFYLIPVDALEGGLRKEEIVDGDRLLLPPFWASERDIRQRFIRRDSSPLVCDTHKPVFVKALHALLHRELYV